MTSTIQSLCPSCNGHIPFIDISYEYPDYYLDINCECGFNKKVKVLDYLKNYKPDDSNVVTYKSECDKHKEKYKHYCVRCDRYLCGKCIKEHEQKMIIHFDDYSEQILEKKTKIQKKYKEIQDEIKRIKSDLINEIIKLTQIRIRDIEFEYQEFINNNNAIMNYLTILINNYKGDNYPMLYNIIDYDFNFRKPDANESVSELFNELTSFPIVRKQSNHSDKIDEIKSENPNKNVYSMIILKDGRYALTFNEDNEPILIIDPKTNFNIDIKIDFYEEKVYSLSQLDNDYLLTFSVHRLTMYSLDKYSYKMIHSGPSTESTMGVAVPGNLLWYADGEVFSLWSYNDERTKYEKDIIENDGIEKIHFLRNLNIIVGRRNMILYFINVNTTQTECKMELKNKAKDFDSDDIYLYVGTDSEILIINQKTFIIEKEISNVKFDELYFMRRLYNNIFLCEGDSNELFIWDIEKDKNRIIPFECRRKFGLVLSDYYNSSIKNTFL